MQEGRLKKIPPSAGFFYVKFVLNKFYQLMEIINKIYPSYYFTGNCDLQKQR